MLSLCTATLALSSPATAPPKAALRSLFSAAPDDVLACPLPGKQPLRSEVIVLGSEQRSRKLSESGVRYPVNALYADLLPSAGRSSPLSFAELGQELQDAWESRVQTSLFRSPLTAFLYERGWREGFKNAGFPGIDAEFEEVNEFFKPAAGGVVVDMSCGSGLMTRRLVKSGAYKRVLALDYSEAMLTETARRVRVEGVPAGALTLCRADVAALPIRPGSIDAMHAGAAMHCWPRLEAGLSEIRQALKPGGRFFATTFFQGAYGVNMPSQTGGGSFRFFKDEEELRALLIGAGFPEAGVTVRREGRGCAIIKCEVVEASTAVKEAAAAIEEAAAAIEEVAAIVEQQDKNVEVVEVKDVEVVEGLE